FARAVGSQQRQQLPSLNRQINAIDGGEFAKTDTEVLRLHAVAIFIRIKFGCCYRESTGLFTIPHSRWFNTVHFNLRTAVQHEQIFKLWFSWRNDGIGWQLAHG